MANLRIIGVLAALGTVGFTFAIGAYPPSAHAQTQGMDRREDRRDTRQDSRDVKQACKAGDEKTRAECRQDKRDRSSRAARIERRRNSGEPTTNAGRPRPARPVSELAWEIRSRSASSPWIERSGCDPASETAP